jgi:hypothetical protein
MRRIPLVLAVLLAACGPKKAKQEEFPVPEGPPDAGAASMEAIPQDLQDETEAAIAFIEELSTAASAVKNDGDTYCDSVATAMKAVVDGPHGKAIITIDADARFNTYANAINDKYGKQLNAMNDHLEAAVGACGGHPGVTQVLIDAGILTDDQAQPPATDD